MLICALFLKPNPGIIISSRPKALWLLTWSLYVMDMYGGCLQFPAGQYSEHTYPSKHSLQLNAYCVLALACRTSEANETQ